MRIEYGGADITGDVEFSRCVYDAGGDLVAPRLSVEFDDDSGLWDKWAPSVGDRIAVSEAGVAATGAMRVERVAPKSGGYAVTASAFPVADARAVREWRDTTLLTVAGQLARVLGLGLATYGVADMSLARVRQGDEPAADVLARLAALSGCIIDVFDGALTLCSLDWAETQGSAGTLALEDDSEFAYSRGRAFASCSLAQAESDGIPGIEESYGDGEPRFAAALSGAVAFPGSAELKRACAAVLARENARRSGGWARGETLTPFTPGAVCAVACDKAASLTGAGIVTRIRNDFSNGISKTWWRAL